MPCPVGRSPNDARGLAAIRLDPMIDLHSHILPGIDDGARDIEMSIAMARASVADGVSVLACTPHIMPGVWNNAGPQIRDHVARLQDKLNELEIPLHLVVGADVHIAPDLVGGVRSGRIPTLHGTRYVLLEMPHHVAPPHADQCFYSLLTAGYVPIFTHPERLSWLSSHYGLIKRLARSGVWMQITAGSLTGGFGKRAQYWAEKMLNEGLVHILASDTHNVTSRPPSLGAGWEAACRIVGEDEAYHLVVTRPYGILNNDLPASLPPPPMKDTADDYQETSGKTQAGRAIGALFRGGGSGDEPGGRALPGWMRRIFARRDG